VAPDGKIPQEGCLKKRKIKAKAPLFAMNATSLDTSNLSAQNWRRVRTRETL